MPTIADALARLFSADGFVPRRICGRWPDWLVAEHIAGNAMIWLAYAALPILIWRLARRRSELRPFRVLALSLAFFVGLCGLGHFLDMVAFFRPMYRLSGHVLIATGLVSWWTAWTMLRAWPAIVAMKSPDELERRIAERTEELTRAIAELKRSEIDRAHLATIVRSSNDAIISKDLDGVITSWNAGAERLFGHPAAEAIGRSVTFLIPPDHLAEEPIILAKLRAGEPIEPFETVRVTGDGRRIDVSLSLSPIKDGSGRVVGVSKIVTDVTERKRAAEALRDSERRFRALIETLPQLVWSTNAAGDNEYSSPQWFAYTGCADIAELKARWGEVLHADDRARFESTWMGSVASGEPFDMEYRMRRHDGVFRWFKVRGVPIRDGDGRVVRWFGTCTDIHEQMLAEEALRASERLYRAIGESIPFGIWISDPEGRNTYVSESFLRLAGLSQEECSEFGSQEERSESNWKRVHHPDDAERMIAAWKECVRTEGTWDVEQRILGVDGLWHPILSRGVPVRDDDGEVFCWAGINLDIGGLKRAEEALRASEDRQRQALLAARIGHWEFDLKAGRVTYLNGLKVLYGRAGEPPSNSFEEAIGFLHPDDRAGVRAAVEHAISTDVPLDIEQRVLWPDGSIRWLASKGVVFRDESGEPLRMVGVNVDVTERKEAEIQVRLLNEGLERRVEERTAELAEANEALRHEERRFQAIFDSMFQFIGLLSPEGIILEVNRAALELGGHTRDEVVGRPIWEAQIWPDDDERDRVRRAIQSAAGGEFVRYEVDIRAAGSIETLDFSIKPMFDGSGRVALLIPEARIITEQKRAAEDLRQSEAALKESQRLAGVGSWEWDPVSDIVVWSEEFCRIAGRDPGQWRLAYADHAEVFAASSLDRLKAVVAETMKTGAPYELELELIVGDGSSRWIISRGEAVRGPDGRVAKLRGTVLDVTARKRFEEELRQARDQAMAATRVKGEFLANMSHEIRTPMNGVIGMTELLLDTPLDAEQKGFAETIRSSGEALLRVIDDILDFSKIEAGKMTLDISGFDLRALVDDIAGLLAPKARQKGLQVGRHVDPEIPGRLLGDSIRVRQVLLNLAGNAIKFTDSGRVDLEAELLSIGESSARVRVLIRDTGIGIPEDRQAEVFESFTQVEGGSTRRHGGTGLGLTICRSLVALMGGEIGLESRPGLGSTFWFELTLGKDRRAEARPAPEPAAWHSPLPEPLRILMAEDNEVNRRVVVGMADRLGCQVEAVHNGREALEALERGGHFDVVLMDVQMPEMDGFAATAAIREREIGTGGHVPIIAMTAHAMRGDRERCLAAGMDGYLSKPIRPGPLREALLARSTDSDPAPSPRPIDERSYSRDALAESCGGDPSLVAEILGLMLEETPARLGRLEEAIASGDGRRLYREAHALSGSFLAVGAEPLASACRNLMKIGRRGDFASARGVLREVVCLWDRLGADLARRRDESAVITPFPVLPA